MPEKWTGEVVGTLHVNEKTAVELAAAIGWNPKYLSTVLNGHNNPKNAEKKVRAGLKKLLEK